MGFGSLSVRKFIFLGILIVVSSIDAASSASYNTFSFIRFSTAGSVNILSALGLKFGATCNKALITFDKSYE